MRNEPQALAVRPYAQPPFHRLQNTNTKQNGSIPHPFERMGAQGPRSESDEHPNWNPDTRPVDLAKRISHAAAARSNMLAHRSSRTPQRPRDPLVRTCISQQHPHPRARPHLCAQWHLCERPPPVRVYVRAVPIAKGGPTRPSTPDAPLTQKGARRTHIHRAPSKLASSKLACMNLNAYARVSISSRTLAMNSSTPMGTVSFVRSRTEMLPASTSFSPRISM